MYVLTNGSLVTLAKGQRIVYSGDSFCIDGAVGHQHHTFLSEDSHLQFEAHDFEHLSGSELDQIAIICYPSQIDDSADASFVSGIC